MDEDTLEALCDLQNEVLSTTSDSEHEDQEQDQEQESDNTDDYIGRSSYDLYLIDIMAPVVLTLYRTYSAEWSKHVHRMPGGWSSVDKTMRAKFPNKSMSLGKARIRWNTIMRNCDRIVFRNGKTTDLLSYLYSKCGDALRANFNFRECKKRTGDNQIEEKEEPKEIVATSVGNGGSMGPNIALDSVWSSWDAEQRRRILTSHLPFEEMASQFRAMVRDCPTFPVDAMWEYLTPEQKTTMFYRTLSSISK
jgi:hypothetical protein